VSPWAVTTSDLGVDDGKIAAVGPNLSGRTEIDATGLLVLPGAIDAHTHMALPVAGTQSSDDFLSGSRAAACGGVTTLVDFTVGAPERSIPEAIEQRIRDAADSVIDYAFHGEVIGWNAGQESEFRDAVSLGVTSFKFYTAYEASGRRTSSETLSAAFKALARINAVALVHAEDEGLIQSISSRLSKADRSVMRTLAKARPDLCEQAAISTVAHIAREANCALHIVHVSSGLGLDALRAARSAGTAITGETCPQYLLLTREDYDRPDGHLFSATPALRTGSDLSALWVGLRTHDIDFVASDHCSFTRAQKTWHGSFEDLPYGLPGVETLLPLIHSEGVARGILTLTDIPRLLSESPAKRYGLYPRKGTLEIGSDADIVLFDPNSTWEIDANSLHMATDFSPYQGRTVMGRVTATICRGDIVFSEGRLEAKPGRGEYVFRQVRKRG